MTFDEWATELGLEKDLNGDYCFGWQRDAAELLVLWGEEKGYKLTSRSNSRGEWVVTDYDFTSEEEDENEENS